MNNRIGIVGATGAVGQEFLHLLEQRNFPVGQLRLFASARSAGKSVSWRNETITIEEATPDIFDQLDIALFSIGASVSRELAPAAARSGCVVVDNSSAFRMDPNVPLVVPEMVACATKVNSNAVVLSSAHVVMFSKPEGKAAIWYSQFS